MATNKELVALAHEVQLGNYKPAPFVLSEGRACRVWDVEGRSYLDLSGGIAVLSVGHAHPKLALAIAEQASRLIHTSNLFYNDRAIGLAAELTKRTGFARAFFCNSGAEANEAMLKLARRWHDDRGDKTRKEIVSTLGSFHGRTMGALTLTGQLKYHAGMEPLLPGVHHVPYGDLDAMRAKVGPKTAAVIVEPIQAEGGIIVGKDDYLRGLRQLCDNVGALLLFDEVQTGYGRTGKFLGREWSGVIPDACSLAKGIAGGMPLGAMLVGERVHDGLPPGSHASTFGGNPVACAAGLAVLRIFDEERLVEAAAERGAFLLEKLSGKLPSVTEVRGRGLLIGLALEANVDPLATLAKIREKGVLLSIAGGNVLRISPPLVVTEGELEEGLRVILDVLRDPPRVQP